MSDMLKLYSPRLTAREKPELFEPVELDLTQDDEDGDPKLGKFNLPVCIEAIMRVETEVMFLVRSSTHFAPRKQHAMCFHTPEEAQTFIDNELKPRYSDNWSFVIWSLSALIK